MLIQLCLRLLLAHVWSRDKEMEKWGSGWSNNVNKHCNGHIFSRDLSPPPSQIKLLHLMDGAGSEPTERLIPTTAGQGEVDCVYITVHRG